MPFFRRSKTPEGPPPEPDETPQDMGELAVAEAAANPYNGVYVNEVNPDFLQHMAGMRHQTTGKFIRIGDLVLVAPMNGMQGVGINHSDMIGWAPSDLKERIVAAQEAASGSGEEPLKENKSGITDAGLFDLRTGQEDAVQGVEVYGKSGSYTRSDEEGRKTTVEDFAGRLPGIEVTNGDLSKRE